MSDKTKKCPLCAEQIPLEATTCEYCGAKFRVTAAGYCTTCHDIREADANGRCKVCGMEVADLRVESKFSEEAAPQPAPPPPAQPVPIPPVSPALPAKKRSTGLWIAGGALAFVILCSVIGLMLWTQRGNLPGLSGLFATPTLTTTPTFTPTSPSTPTSTRTSTPVLSGLPVEYIPVTATAKDFYDYEYRWKQPGLLLGRPEQMINGVINQKWQTDGWIGNAHQNLWVMFEFSNIVDLTTIVAYASNDGVVKSYYVQASTDGFTWSNIHAGKATTASGEISTFTFHEIQTKYIRFEDIDTAPDNNLSFTEVKFFRLSQETCANRQSTESACGETQKEKQDD